MLKIAVEAEERWGAALMVWWGGEGAVRVLAHEGEALLLERASGEDSLVEMSRNGRDDEASRIICTWLVFRQLRSFQDAESCSAELEGLLRQIGKVSR